MSAPRVSIIIPAYNVEKYIEKCLLSCINQTLKDIEIIIINDGSTDKTLEIIEKFEEKDKRIKVINKKNEGLSAARNDGIKISKANYIQHLDGDDWIECNALEKLYNVAIKNNLDIVVSNFYYDNPDGYIHKSVQNLTSGKIYNGMEFLINFFEGGVMPDVWNKLLKKELYIKNNIEAPVGISMGEDLAVTLRLAYYAEKIEFLEDAFVHYVQNPSSITQNKRSEKLSEIIEVVKINNNFFRNKLFQTEYDKYLKSALRMISYSFTICSDIDFNSSKMKNGIKKLKEFLTNEVSDKHIAESSFEARQAFYMVKEIELNRGFVLIWKLKSCIITTLLTIKNKIRYEYSKIKNK